MKHIGIASGIALAITTLLFTTNGFATHNQHLAEFLGSFIGLLIFPGSIAGGVSWWLSRESRDDVLDLSDFDPDNE